MDTLGDPPRYRAYLLRLWLERGQAGPSAAVWRFSVEDPRSGERRGFADLDALVAHLAALTITAEGESEVGADD